MSLLSRVQTLREDLSASRRETDALRPEDATTYAAIFAAAKRRKPQDVLLIALDADPGPATYGELDEAYQRITLALEGVAPSPSTGRRRG